MHAQQASTAIKQEGLEKACNKLIGRRRSAREIKKGHGSTKNDYSVVLPTRVLAQSQGHTSLIDARNSLHDQAEVQAGIKRLTQYCLTKTWQSCGAHKNVSNLKLDELAQPKSIKKCHNDATLHALAWGCVDDRDSDHESI
jgi:hypothetical protein